MKIGNLDISAFKVGVNDCSIYLGNVKLYPNEEPQPVGDCYSVIFTPISDYTSTDYDSVFSYSDLKWYMKNNLNQYEEYGIYETASTLSELTYYDGKLVIVDGYEYQYSNGSWINKGEATAGTFVPLSLDSEDNLEVQKIRIDLNPVIGGEVTKSVAASFSMSPGGFFIDNGYQVNIDSSDSRINCFGQAEIGHGTPEIKITALTEVDTNVYEFDFGSTVYFRPMDSSDSENNMEKVLASEGEADVPLEYATKDKPLAEIFNTVADMEAVGCPTVGVGQYGIVGNNAYQYGSNNQWIIDNTTKLIATYSNEKGLVVDCNTSNILTSVEIQPLYLTASAMTNAVIGGCVTSIDGYAFYGCSSLTSVTIGNSVTSIGDDAFLNCSGLTSINIPNSVTSIGILAFYGCSGLTSITVEATTPPTLGGNAFSNTNNCPIYVPAASVDTYKAASGWSTYENIILPIPTT